MGKRRHRTDYNYDGSGGDDQQRGDTPPRNNEPNSNDDDSDEDSSRYHRRHKRKKKRGKHHHHLSSDDQRQRDHASSSRKKEKDIGYEDHDQPRSDEHHRSRNSSRRHRHKSRNGESSDDDENLSSDGSRDYERRQRKGKDRDRDNTRRNDKKARKEKKRDRKKGRKHNKRSDSDEGSTRDSRDDPFHDRNASIANSILELLTECPGLATDLPILMVQLVNGTTLDLSKMTDDRASRGLARVFVTLESFGVSRDGITGCWKWVSPTGRGNGNHRSSDLLLVRVVRGVLDQMGLTMAAVEAYEESITRSQHEGQFQSDQSRTLDSKEPDVDVSNVERLVLSILRQYDARESKLAQELCGLMELILQGESIALDGLPDAQLRQSLESLFTTCGLEKSEMEMCQEDDDGNGVGDSKEEDEAAITMGYTLPDNVEMEASRAKLLAVIKVCQEGPKNRRRAVKGPLLDPTAYADSAPDENGAESSDDEGPVPRGVKLKGPSLPSDVVEVQAARRALEMECAKVGVALPLTSNSGDGPQSREEWMLVPGKFDFLGSIKAGQPMKSRTFEGKTKNASTADAPVLDPTVQAEIDEIMQAHDKARGPSLMDIHLQKKAEQKQDAGFAGRNKSSWKWSRDKDLDAGRSVDKNALNMILGGASSDLKNKFHGGFG